MPQDKTTSLTELQSVFADPAVPAYLEQITPEAFATASNFWRIPMESAHITPRMKELVLLAMHACATAMNQEAISRHIERAKGAGASDEDVLDVLLSIVGLANHSLYACVPLLLDELQQAGSEEGTLPPADANYEAIKENFMKKRGFWNPERDPLARLMPEYFDALNRLSVEPWQSGSLTPKEREFIYIAIDCTVTHSYGPGLRLHIRNALKHGARREEILDVFRLAALMGLEGYILGAKALRELKTAPANGSI
jgi:alkylhydroperoxidase/carboxymuconolactone decarboxylase family protein YurZ